MEWVSNGLLLRVHGLLMGYYLGTVYLLTALSAPMWDAVAVSELLPATRWLCSGALSLSRSSTFSLVRASTWFCSRWWAWDQWDSRLENCSWRARICCLRSWVHTQARTHGHTQTWRHPRMNTHTPWMRVRQTNQCGGYWTHVQFGCWVFVYKAVCYKLLWDLKLTSIVVAK